MLLSMPSNLIDMKQFISSIKTGSYELRVGDWYDKTEYEEYED